jgi:hypothetical protein
MLAAQFRVSANAAGAAKQYRKEYDVAKNKAKAAKPKAEKKPEKAPEPKTVTVPKFIKDHYEEIRSKEREVRGLEMSYETKAAAAKTAKKLFEESDMEMRSMIARGPDRQLKLPLGKKSTGEVGKAATANGTSHEQVISRVRLMATVEGVEKGTELAVKLVDGKLTFAIADPASEAAPKDVILEPGQYEAIAWADVPQANSDAWRKAPIKELGLTEKLAELLPETIGDLEDLRADIATGKKEWPKGIGNGKVTMIEDAVIDWLTKHRDKF